MQQKSALLLGATGLTGSHLLGLLLENSEYKTVYVYTRSSLGIQHPKLFELIIDFDTYDKAVLADDVFCCLGTTIKKAKSKEAFRKVDLEYPVKFAKLQFDNGSKKLMVISAMGASTDSLFFYSQVKAEMERQLAEIGYTCLGIFRPALITGNRKEHRSGEKLASLINGWINPLLMGSLKKYRSIPASTIAKAMLSFAIDPTKTGIQVLLSDELC